MTDQNDMGFNTAKLKRGFYWWVALLFAGAIGTQWRVQLTTARETIDYLKKEKERCETKNERYEYVLIPQLKDKVDEAAKQIDTLSERIYNSKNKKQ